MERNLATRLSFAWRFDGAFLSPVMTKCPKSQICRPTYFSVVASAMMELESVSDENFES